MAAAGGRQSQVAYLVLDPWIAISWLVFLIPGLISALLLRANEAHPLPAGVPPHPATFSQLASMFVFTGYMFWSLYHGWAACLRLLLRIGRKFSAYFPMAYAAGCLYFLSVGGVSMLLGALYSWLGGGIFHFFRRWYQLCRGERPPFLGLPGATDALHERLRHLDELRGRGAITHDEYDRMRANTLGTF